MLLQGHRMLHVCHCCILLHVRGYFSIWPIGGFSPPEEIRETIPHPQLSFAVGQTWKQRQNIGSRASYISTCLNFKSYQWFQSNCSGFYHSAACEFGYRCSQTTPVTRTHVHLAIWCGTVSDDTSWHASPGLRKKKQFIPVKSVRHLINTHFNILHPPFLRMLQKSLWLWAAPPQPPTTEVRYAH